MAYGTERAKEIGNVASIQNPGAIAGSASEGLQQYGSDIPRGMTGICSLNRRVRSRTHGSVGGGDREFLLSRLGPYKVASLVFYHPAGLLATTVLRVY
jgi:hypothetical protein